jgi:hypothetical protein
MKEHRLNALTLNLKSKPDEKTLKSITDLGGVYSPYDYVTNKTHVVWFDDLDEKDLKDLLKIGDVFCGTEQRYSVESGKELDGKDKLVVITKSNIKEHEAKLTTNAKMKVIRDVKYPPEASPITPKEEKPKDDKPAKEVKAK